MPTPGVQVRQTTVSLPTYEPLPPDKHPMFLEKRVYQGSSGKIYPLPFYNRIAAEKSNRDWAAVYIENEFLEVMILPEIGGRIHAGRDKVNGYDFFYRQNVIKPALVGLAGPWASGGVEFNWPQHHRPATFMPVDVEVEESSDGSKTVWLSDHDPMCRMKGMHGICLHPDKAYIELKVRAYNRTVFVQHFLWWANVATRVHEGYQSFFPPDVTHVADHAKRAIATYPLCDGIYYGVNYGERAKGGVPADEIPECFVPPHIHRTDGSQIPHYSPNDLSWYANIPVPTSYMCLGSEADFFGGYDHVKQAGLVHVANHHISPGKKQWTWGNHGFGYAWDRNLTDEDGPYIEIMAGVYTDNQPDFSFLNPGETKSWSQFWYPIREIGPTQAANEDAAVSLRSSKGIARIGVHVTSQFPNATIRLVLGEKQIKSWSVDLLPGAPFTHELKLPRGAEADRLKVEVIARDGRSVITYEPRTPKHNIPAAATAPPEPREVSSQDQLYLIGVHLDQYNHATRGPAPYWQEALRRDPDDSRCNNALGLWHLKRGEFQLSEKHFRKAISRVTEHNPNPRDGEPFYNFGILLRLLGRDTEAYAAFYKAVWNQAWQSAGYHALAEIDASRGNWKTALEHLEYSLRLNTDNLRARDLKALVLQHIGRNEDASAFIKSTLNLDPLDWWARHISGEDIACDTQTRIDLALDYVRSGFTAKAIALLELANENCDPGSAPLIAYYIASFYERQEDRASQSRWLKKAAKQPTDYCFPARLEEIAILESAIRKNPGDYKAPYYLGNLLYDKHRHGDAIRYWELSTRINPHFSIVWRNLGIAYYNFAKKPKKARDAYERAFALNPREPRLLYERDQLWKRLRVAPIKRLAELEKHRALINERDDLSVEYCALLNQTGQSDEAAAILRDRTFQPWEGGEGQTLGQHVRTCINLARKARRSGDLTAARANLEAALQSPSNLGEARHLLANRSDIHFLLGEVINGQGDIETARSYWKKAANYLGDFQDMSVKRFSEMTYFSALSMMRLGNNAGARGLLRELLAYARELAVAAATIDYFATSLPTMLLFDEDIQDRQITQSLFLQAQAKFGLGKAKEARALLTSVLKRDPSHALALDLISELRSASEKAAK